MDKLTTYAIAGIILTFFLYLYHRSVKKRDAAARQSAEKGKVHSGGPQAQYPHIDITRCIGCAGCTLVCPEGDVLAMLGGKAVIVNGYKCIGHSLCAEACPVGAITMVMSGPSLGADMPFLTEEHETSISNLFIVGELGGLTHLSWVVTAYLLSSTVVTPLYGKLGDLHGRRPRRRPHPPNPCHSTEPRAPISA